MSVHIIVGANWGDEGKGKMTDYLAERSDIVVRFQGGANAGHTIINSYGKFALHLLPSGSFYPHVTNILGPGVAVDIPLLCKELSELEDRGVPKPLLIISNRAQVVLPLHKQLDVYEEERLGIRQFGSTHQGIAPFYSDKYAKIGIQVSDLFNPNLLKEKITHLLELKNVLLIHLYGRTPLETEPVVQVLLRMGELVKPYVQDTTQLIRNALQLGKAVLMEGQLGALRDPDNGIYPFTTSTSTLSGFTCVGGGIAPKDITRVTAVVKAYSTCVGAGPFVTGLDGAAGDELRSRGGSDGEYGATTGRPRRVGWFDTVATRYGCAVQGATDAALTLLDVLGYLDEIPVCTGYEGTDLNRDSSMGISQGTFPETAQLYCAKPVYRKLPGWKCSIAGIREFNKLPVNAQKYVRFIEEQIEVPVRWLSVGPRREDTIEM